MYGHVTTSTQGLYTLGIILITDEAQGIMIFTEIPFSHQNVPYQNFQSTRKHTFLISTLSAK